MYTFYVADLAFFCIKFIIRIANISMTCERVGLNPALSAYYDVSDAFAAEAGIGRKVNTERKT